MCLHLLLCLWAFAASTFLLFVCVWNSLWRGHQRLNFSLSVCLTASIERLVKVLFNLLLVQFWNVLGILLVSIKCLWSLSCFLVINKFPLFFFGGKGRMKDRYRLFRSVVIVTTLGLFNRCLLVGCLSGKQGWCELPLTWLGVYIS